MFWPGSLSLMDATSKRGPEGACPRIAGIRKTEAAAAKQAMLRMASHYIPRLCLNTREPSLHERTLRPFRLPLPGRLSRPARGYRVVLLSQLLPRLSRCFDRFPREPCGGRIDRGRVPGEPARR